MAQKGYTNFPGGITSMGTPVTGVTSGEIYFVHKTGAAGNKGTASSPINSVNSALDKCTANSGDIVYLMPGHTESIIDATSFLLDVAGVSVIGLGSGNDIPTISLTAAAGTIAFTAASVTLQNIKVLSAFTTGVTIGINVAATADGANIIGVQMRETLATKEFLKWINIATTVTDLVISGCTLHGIIAGSDANAIFFAGSSTDALIENNVIFGDFSGDVIDHNTTVPVSIRLLGNRIVNMDGGAAGDCISIKTAGTGYAFDNYGFYNKNDATVFTGDAIVWDQNSANNTLASSGILPHPAAVGAVP